MVKNELLKMKKIKKEKSKKILTEIAEPSNEAVEPLKSEEVVSKTPNKEKKKKKKRKSEDDPTETTEAKKAKEVTEEPSTDTTKVTVVKEITKEPAGKQSNIRTVKKRLEADCDYIAGLMASFHMPQHLRDEDDSEDDEVYVKDDDKEKMRKVLDVAENRAANQEELQERLKAKLDELRGKNVVGNEAKKKKKMKKQLAMIEKKKALKEEVKMKQKLMKIGQNAGGGGGNKVKMEALEAIGGKAAKPAVKTSSGKVIFSKFDFTEEAGLAEKKQDIDPKAALKQIEKKKEKIKILEERGKTEKIKVLEDRAAWQTAMDRAEGAVIKDDVTLLKKSIKKNEQRKKSSKNKWENRVENIEKRKEGKQSKRTENIQKRKKDKKEKKMGKRG